MNEPCYIVERHSWKKTHEGLEGAIEYAAKVEKPVVAHNADGSRETVWTPPVKPARVWKSSQIVEMDAHDWS